MKQIIRIIICSLSLLATLEAEANNLEPAVINDTPEFISKNYIQIDGSKANPLTMRPSEVIMDVAAVIPKVKAYSLLAWKALTRASDMEVESYNRVHHFGRWVNDKRDKDCHNTRAKVLIRDSETPVVFKPDNRCTVESGEWNDPYTKSVLTDAISEVQVDHLVPLKNAFVSGAHSWNYQTRCLYANYLGSNYHLKPIDGEENMRKSDGTPARYVPSNPEYRCTYIKNWLMVKLAWNLEMTAKEAYAIKEVIAEENCNPQQFQMTTGEINEHRRFFKSNIELCPSVPPPIE